MPLDSRLQARRKAFAPLRGRSCIEPPLLQAEVSGHGCGGSNQRFGQRLRGPEDLALFLFRRSRLRERQDVYVCGGAIDDAPEVERSTADDNNRVGFTLEGEQLAHLPQSLVDVETNLLWHVE
jgi:hypothetical protein